MLSGLERTEGDVGVRRGDREVEHDVHLRVRQEIVDTTAGYTLGGADSCGSRFSGLSLP
jgi:hypothetical protein